MTKDLKLVNMTTQDFASAKDLELFEIRWEKMGKEYYPLLRKGGMIKHSVLKQQETKHLDLKMANLL